jgi:hypothetical protein
MAGNFSFNGIQGAINVPGQLPWFYVVGYFVAALIIAFIIGRRTGGLGQFTTLDWVFIGIGAAFAVVWQFFIGSFLGGFVPSGLSNYISIGFWGGQLLSMMVVAALVRKVGVGMVSFVVYSFLGDLFHYGFGGEPVYFFYEALTYGLFLDLMIAFTGGNIFAVKSSLKASAESTGDAKGGGSSGKLVSIMVVEGAIIGFLFAFPDPIIYSGFFASFLSGFTPNWQNNYSLLTAFLISGVPAGAVAAVLANRIARALGQ